MQVRDGHVVQVHPQVQEVETTSQLPKETDSESVTTYQYQATSLPVPEQPKGPFSGASDPHPPVLKKLSSTGCG